MIAAILGTLKSGSPYVPLDPNSPVERVQMILADTRPCLIVTQEALQNRLPDADVTVLCIDSIWDSEGDDTRRPPESGVRSDDLAYIMYTSGSTGRPKGVMVEHRAICNTILCATKTCQSTPTTSC